MEINTHLMKQRCPKCLQATNHRSLKNNANTQGRNGAVYHITFSATNGSIACIALNHPHAFPLFRPKMPGSHRYAQKVWVLRLTDTEFYAFLGMENKQFVYFR